MIYKLKRVDRKTGKIKLNYLLMQCFLKDPKTFNTPEINFPGKKIYQLQEFINKTKNIRWMDAKDGR